MNFILLLLLVVFCYSVEAAIKCVEWTSDAEKEPILFSDGTSLRLWKNGYNRMVLEKPPNAFVYIWINDHLIEAGDNTQIDPDGKAYVCVSSTPVTAITNPAAYDINRNYAATYFAKDENGSKVDDLSEKILELIDKESDVFADVDIIVSDKEGSSVTFPASKLLLSAYSPYYHSFFNKNGAGYHMKQGRTEKRLTIEEKDFQAAVVDDFLKFMAGAKPDFDQNKDNFEWFRDRLDFASFAQIERYLEANIDWCIANIQSPKVAINCELLMMTNEFPRAKEFEKKLLPYLLLIKYNVPNVEMKVMYDYLLQMVNQSPDHISQDLKSFLVENITPSNAIETWLIIQRVNPGQIAPVEAYLKANRLYLDTIIDCDTFKLVTAQEFQKFIQLFNIGSSCVRNQ